MKKTVVLDPTQLLGFRIEQQGGQINSKVGGKIGTKEGRKQVHRP